MSRYRIPLSRAQKEFDRYDLTEHIDSGGQKDVFKGTLNGEDIVLKTVVVNSYSASKRAEREVEAMEIVESDILVNLIENYPDEIDGNDIFVMVEEYVPGSTLRDHLDERGPSIELGMTVAKQLLTVLCEFDERSMVHRDIKPRNIMITPDSSVRLLDVGIVRMLNEEGLTPTHQDHAPGTLRYSAPEQLANNKDKQDTRTDLFSAGIVIFETMTGTHPFDTGEVPTEEAINAGERLSVSDAMDHPVAERVEQYISFLLNTQMNNRFRKPEHALEHLENLEESIL